MKFMVFFVLNFAICQVVMHRGGALTLTLTYINIKINGTLDPYRQFRNRDGIIIPLQGVYLFWSRNALFRFVRCFCGLWTYNLDLIQSFAFRVSQFQFHLFLMDNKCYKKRPISKYQLRRLILLSAEAVLLWLRLA
jgi:hypothetical protein